MPLKEDDTYLVLNEKGFAEEGAEGFYRHDTRFLSFRNLSPRPVEVWVKVGSLWTYSKLVVGIRR